MDIEESRRPSRRRSKAGGPRYVMHQACWLATSLYDKAQRTCAKILQQLYQAFIGSGASLAEISPLITAPGRSQGDRRHSASTTTSSSVARALRRCDTSAGRAETLARGRTHLHQLGRNISSVIQRRGAPMADGPDQVLRGQPASFLDIGGSSRTRKVVNTLKIITSDPNVKVIVFNIFGRIAVRRRSEQDHRGHVASTSGSARHPSDQDERGEGARDPGRSRVQRDDLDGRVVQRLKWRGSEPWRSSLTKTPGFWFKDHQAG